MFHIKNRFGTMDKKKLLIRHAFKYIIQNEKKSKLPICFNDDKNNKNVGQFQLSNMFQNFIFALTVNSSAIGQN